MDQVVGQADVEADGQMSDPWNQLSIPEIEALPEGTGMSDPWKLKLFLNSRCLEGMQDAMNACKLLISISIIRKKLLASRLLCSQHQSFYK